MSVPRKVLVTGGAGFIGSYVVDRLLAQGTEVLVLDHSTPGTLRTNEAREGVEIFHGDVRDDVAVTEAAAHVDGVIHLAAVLGTQETIKNPRPAAYTNILGSLNVLEAANQYDLPVVYAGVGNYWMREHGAGTYTITKTAIEDFIRMYNHFRDGRISVVRPVNAYGPRQSVAAPFGTSKVRKIMPSFICRALTQTPIEVYGNGLSVSDCVHVADVAEVFVRALNVTEGGQLGNYEVGPEESLTVKEIAELVSVTAALKTGSATVPIEHLPMRPGEVPNSVTKAKAGSLAPLGLDPSKDFISLQQGVYDTVSWFHENWLPSYQAAQA